MCHGGKSCLECVVCEVCVVSDWHICICMSIQSCMYAIRRRVSE